MNICNIQKGLAIGIILLFVGTGIIPAIAQNMEKLSLPTSRGIWLYVGGSGPGNYSKIQDAVDNSSDGDAVFVYNDSSPYYENVVVDKSINLIGEDRDTTVIRSDGFSIFSIIVDNVNVSGFKVVGSSNGIYIGSDNNIISGNYFEFNWIGIKLWGASNNVISNNIMQYIDCDGILFSYDCNKNTILNNTIECIFRSCIYLEGSTSGNVIINNVIKSATFGIYFTSLLFHSPSNNDIIGNYIQGAMRGIYLGGSFGGSVSDNIIIKNSVGIELKSSRPDMITGNYIIENNYQGIRITSHSRFNKITYNTFMNNTQHAFFSDCIYNIWDYNFWGRPRLLPYPIFGYLWYGKLLHVPWVNIDWHPAQEPYDIPGMR